MCSLHTTTEKLRKSFPPAPYKDKMLCLMTAQDIWNNKMCMRDGGSKDSPARGKTVHFAGNFKIRLLVPCQTKNWFKTQGTQKSCLPTSCTGWMVVTVYFPRAADLLLYKYDFNLSQCLETFTNAFLYPTTAWNQISLLAQRLVCDAEGTMRTPRCRAVIQKPDTNFIYSCGVLS